MGCRICQLGITADLAWISLNRLCCPIFQDFEKCMFGILEAYLFILRKSSFSDLKSYLIPLRFR